MVRLIDRITCSENREGVAHMYILAALVFSELSCQAETGRALLANNIRVCSAFFPKRNGRLTVTAYALYNTHINDQRSSHHLLINLFEISHLACV